MYLNSSNAAVVFLILLSVTSMYLSDVDGIGL